MDRRESIVANRTAILFALLFIAGGYFLFDLFQKQVLDHSQYVEAATSQSTAVAEQPAPRGQIYAQDKDGKLFALAQSEWKYQLLISPRQVGDKQKLVDSLASDVPNFDKTAVFNKINNDKVYVPPVMDGLDATTADKITAKSNSRAYSGVYLVPKLVRVYPDGPNIAPQVIGFVGADGKGKYGVEAYYDTQLQGKAGNETTKRDSLGNLIDVLSNNQPQPGSDLVLTLDYNLQFTVENKLKEALQTYQADSGSVVILDAKTGAVLAMAGQPNYDPNSYRTVPGDQLSLFQIPAISNVYEPGSVFKALNMSSALDLNVVQPSTTHNAGGSVTVDGYTILNALNKNFGNETMSQVIQNSDNVQMVWISSLLGAENERSYLAKFGVGSKTGIDLAGEQAGLLPKLPWPDILRSTAAFGQGVSTTVIQLASDYAAIANGGVTITPHIVQKIVTGDKATTPTAPAGHAVISPTTDQAITQMLVDTVNMGEGKRAGIKGVQVAGKTGTAQVASPNGGYDATKSIGSFAGFFPANDPKYVMVVRLDDPKTVNFAESSAAPTFGAIADWMANYYGLR